VRRLLIRHAPAGRNGSVGIRDGERPLVPRGPARFRVVARGLACIADRLDVLLTSPLIRARSTAGIEAAAFKNVTPRVEPALGRDDLDAVATALENGGAALLACPDGPATAGQLHLRSLGGA
jgi:phosphohistidine phosphatase SixA